MLLLMGHMDRYHNDSALSFTSTAVLALAGSCCAASVQMPDEPTVRRRCKLDPTNLKGTRFQRFNANEENIAFNLNLISSSFRGASRSKKTNVRGVRVRHRL